MNAPFPSLFPKLPTQQHPGQTPHNPHHQYQLIFHHTGLHQKMLGLDYQCRVYHPHVGNIDWARRNRMTNGRRLYFSVASYLAQLPKFIVGSVCFASLFPLSKDHDRRFWKFATALDLRAHEVLAGAESQRCCQVVQVVAYPTLYHSLQQCKPEGNPRALAVECG